MQFDRSKLYRVGIDKDGEPGYITDFEQVGDEWRYTGYTQSGGLLWSSPNPQMTDDGPTPAALRAALRAGYDVS